MKVVNLKKVKFFQMWARFLALCGIAIFAGALVFGADKKIVAIRSSALPVYDQAIAGFRQSLKDQGVAYSLTEETFPETGGEALLARVAGQNPDLILTLGTTASRASKTAVKGIPLVFCVVFDPVAQDLTTSGVAIDLRISSIFSYVRESFPDLQRVGIIYNPARSKSVAEELKGLASQGNLIALQAKSPEEVDQAMGVLIGKAQCLIMLPDSSLYPVQTLGQFILSSFEKNLPIIASSHAFVKAGALAGLYADYQDNGYLAGKTAVRIFAGEKPESIPLLWPVKTNSSINKIVADRLKIKITPAALKQAEVVQ